MSRDERVSKIFKGLAMDFSSHSLHIPQDLAELGLGENLTL